MLLSASLLLLVWSQAGSSSPPPPSSPGRGLGDLFAKLFTKQVRKFNKCFSLQTFALFKVQHGRLKTLNCSALQGKTTELQQRGIFY